MTTLNELEAFLKDIEQQAQEQDARANELLEWLRALPPYTLLPVPSGALPETLPGLRLAFARRRANRGAPPTRN